MDQHLNVAQSIWEQRGKTTTNLSIRPHVSTATHRKPPERFPNYTRGKCGDSKQQSLNYRNTFFLKEHFTGTSLTSLKCEINDEVACKHIFIVSPY